MVSKKQPPFDGTLQTRTCSDEHNASRYASSLIPSTNWKGTSMLETFMTSHYCIAQSRSRLLSLKVYTRCAAAARSLTNRLSARGQYTSACSRLPLTMACRCTPRTIHPRCSQVLLRAADGRLCARVHLSVHCGVQRAVHLVRSCSTQRSECMSTAPRFCQVVRRREVECQSHQSIRQTNDVCDDGVVCQVPSVHQVKNGE